MAHEHHDDNHTNLTTTRLEAFSDAVMAIIITITVLELKIPTGDQLSSLQSLVPLFIIYAISFQTIGTYWNNHHHLLRTTKHVSAGIMWSNLLLLFWLSLIPFATTWLGEYHNAPAPTAFYAFVLWCSGLSYTILQQVVIAHSDKRDQIMQELLKSRKGLISLSCYTLAVMLAFLNPIISDILIIAVSLMWFIPDRRMEKFIS